MGDLSSPSSCLTRRMSAGLTRGLMTAPPSGSKVLRTTANTRTLDTSRTGMAKINRRMMYRYISLLPASASVATNRRPGPAASRQTRSLDLLPALVGGPGLVVEPCGRVPASLQGGRHEVTSTYKDGARLESRGPSLVRYVGYIQSRLDTRKDSGRSSQPAALDPRPLP